MRLYVYPNLFKALGWQAKLARQDFGGFRIALGQACRPVRRHRARLPGLAGTRKYEGGRFPMGRPVH